MCSPVSNEQDSIATIFITICEYGIPHAGHWLLRVMQILFWAYVGLSMCVSALIYMILWSTLYVFSR